MDLRDYLASRRKMVDDALDALLPAEEAEPAVLHRAMRYSIFAGGKRLRPILSVAAAEAVVGSGESVLPVAVAAESVHTYSLIHDDLPAMDDDDLRRGKPTVHKAFGEAVAILAGDALLTFAFEVLSSPHVMRTTRPERVGAAIGEIAHAAGSRGLIAGQVLDVSGEGRPIDESSVDAIVQGKTAALITASLTAAALFVGAGPLETGALRRYGASLGCAFQIKDDLLDLEGDPLTLGKAVGKDAGRGKATYPRLLGAEKAKEKMQGLVDAALDEIRLFGERAMPLAMIAKYVGERIS
jgi:geranylgeranyl diphosphate synthase, type II